MEFVRIEYTGSKVYRDRTAQKTVWNPGDTRPVPAQYAKVLLRFAEFSLCAAQAAAKTEPKGADLDDAELEQAQAAQLAVEHAENDEALQVESMLLTLDTMDKDALIEYATKYETKLDKRKALTDLRGQVGILIEQYGAR